MDVENIFKVTRFDGKSDYYHGLLGDYLRVTDPLILRFSRRQAKAA